MDRRNFVRSAGLSLASLLVSDSLFAAAKKDKPHIISNPDRVSAIADMQTVDLANTGDQLWNFRELVVRLWDTGAGLSVSVNCPKQELSSITLTWKISLNSTSRILNDHWERTYGDVCWHNPRETEILPWYFLEFDGKSINGFGVKTGCRSFCYWKIEKDGLSLILDTKSGGRGIKLGNRTLNAAEIVILRGEPGESPFQTARKFASRMCPKARLPKQPVYGINDWYFSYGNNSEQLIIKHTELISPMAEGLENRPFSIIDDGWFENDDLSLPNSKFPDMAKLADKIRSSGMRPGLWARPLLVNHQTPSNLLLPAVKGRDKPILDPTIPENSERIRSYFNRYKGWGYELVKFDYTSFDLFGKWGFEMLKDGSVSGADWAMHDSSLTNAEIVLNLYQTIREAAGETCLIGCNTFSHLSAGLFELNRIGDDTSGKDWERTRKMGINTLAFRSFHHGIFYSADADCVGLTTQVEWGKNKQWMELLAGSGTPLFISAQPEAVGSEQKTAIRDCFKLSSQTLPVGEPLDWMESAVPVKWRLGACRTFNF
jgi:alpha-galactosidase